MQQEFVMNTATALSN